MVANASVSSLGMLVERMPPDTARSEELFGRRYGNSNAAITTTTTQKSAFDGFVSVEPCFTFPLLGELTSFQHPALLVSLTANQKGRDFAY